MAAITEAKSVVSGKASQGSLCDRVWVVRYDRSLEADCDDVEVRRSGCGRSRHKETTRDNTHARTARRDLDEIAYLEPIFIKERER